MKLGILIAHMALVLLIGFLFGVEAMLCFVAGEVFVISVIETIEGRSPFKWLWEGYRP